MTAADWVPMAEVPPATLETWLIAQKKQGYTIIALEQSADSVMLQSFTFPERVIVLLGREKEGVPLSLLHLVGLCVALVLFCVTCCVFAEDVR